MSIRKTPPPKRRGVVDRFRSVAVAAGPDQREAVVALALHQRGVDRSRKARIVELDRKILPLGFPRGLLPSGAEFGGACEDAKVGRLVVLFLGRNELCLDVERERLDRSG